MVMKYSEFVEVYEALGATTKRLEKESILAEFLRKLAKKGRPEWIYLLKGKVTPDFDPKEFGISRQLTMKALARGAGVSTAKVEEKFRKIGDLGEMADEFAGKKKQSHLFSSELTVDKVFDNLTKLMSIEGKGTVDKKMGLIAELLSCASGKEAKYIVRTLLNDLRIGVADATIRDAIAEALWPENKMEMCKKIEEAYDLANDFAVVFKAAEGGLKDLDKISIIPGRPLNVMLPVKVTEIEEGFRICGRPAALEHKYDGFRVVISKDAKGEVKLFTRKLENVTHQFPDVVEVIKTHVKANTFVIDSEVVGYDPKTKKYRPFEAISQRIRRKYDIETLKKELPVEVNVFDVLYLNGEAILDKEFHERREIVEKIIKADKFKIRPSFQLVTGEDKKAEEFYKEALKIGEEGIMFKKIDARYQQGRRVGFIAKLKPAVNDLDLVIVGAEYGSGKRGGLLTSYIVAVREEGKYLEVGKVSSGLKEIESEEGTTYQQMNDLLKPLIIQEKGNYVKVSPKIIVAVTYQNIQPSPSYDSGYAMRFPRITAYRPDKDVKDVANLKDIEREFKRGLASRKDTLG